MRSNVLTTVGVVVFLVFLGLLAGWKWSGLTLGVLLVFAGWRASLEPDEVVTDGA